MDKRLQLVEFMKQSESKFPVHEWRINDFRIWPIIRNETIFSTVAKNLKGFNFLRDNNVNDSIIDEFHFDNVKKSDVIILSNTIYNQYVDNISYDRFFSGIVDSLYEHDINVLFLNRVTSPIKGKFYNKFINIDPYIERISASNKFWNIDIIDLKGYDDFVVSLKQFGRKENIDVNLVRKEEIIKLYNYIKNLSAFFERIIKKTNAKVFIYPCYYGALGYSINLACSNLGIQSIEMQHGTIDKHVMYSGFGDQTDVKYNIFPKYFWGWSKDTIPESLNCNCHERRERFLYGGNQWYYFWNSKLKKKDCNMKTDKNQINLLFTQQAGIKDFLLEVIRKSPKNYKWFIRFHPRLIKKEREVFIRKIKNINKNVDFEIANSMNLFELLSYMDIHITEFSSSFYEAALMQVPSIIINNLGEKMYNYKDGYYKSAYNAQDLLSCIDELEKNRIKKISENNDIEEVFNNGMERLIKLIDDTSVEYGEISYIDYIENVFDYKCNKTDEEIKEKINNLQFVEDINRLYFIGKYSYLIGEYEKAANNLKKYIIKEYEDLTNIGYVLDSIILYNQIDKEYIKEPFETYEVLEKMMENNEYLIESIFHNLFNNKKYNYVLSMSKFCSENKLTYVYLARSYKALGDYENAINYFLEFISFLQQENINYKSILSVYYHLAESYYLYEDYINAKRFFLKCEEVTGGNHIKAREYLEILNCK